MDPQEDDRNIPIPDKNEARFPTDDIDRCQIAKSKKKCDGDIWLGQDRNRSKLFSHASLDSFFTAVIHCKRDRVRQ